MQHSSAEDAVYCCSGLPHWAKYRQYGLLFNAVGQQKKASPDTRDTFWATTYLECLVVAVDSGADFVGHGGTCPHFYKWLVGTRRGITANKKLNKHRESLTKTTVFTRRTKKVEGHDKKFSRCAPLPSFKFVPAPFDHSTTRLWAIFACCRRLFDVDPGRNPVCRRCEYHGLSMVALGWWFGLRHD